MDIPIHVLNGFLRQVYFLGDHWPVIVCALCGAVHIHATPSERGAWFIAFAVVTAGAAGVAGGVDSTALRPLPYILAFLAVVVVLFVTFDRHSPETLRYRAAGGVAVYAGAVLMFTVFDFMLQTMEAAAFAESLAGSGDSDAMVRTGRHTLRTVVAWGMWLMGPAGIVVMLLQGAITHRPQSGPPSDRLRDIRRPRPRSLHPIEPVPPAGMPRANPPANLPPGHPAARPPAGNPTGYGAFVRRPSGPPAGPQQGNAHPPAG